MRVSLASFTFRRTRRCELRGSLEVCPKTLASSTLVLFVFVLLFCSACGVSGYGAQNAAIKTPVYYTIRPGDTLWSIGQRFGVSDQKVMLLNGLRDPNNLQVGSRVLVGYQYARNTSGGKLVPVKYRQTVRRDAEPSNENAVPSNSQGELLWPLSEGRIVSAFGPRSGSFHDGIDISAATGSPVYAAHSGSVVYAGNRLSGYGNLIILRHSSGLTTVYAHNDRLLVSTGDKVRRGENIAEVGSTGHATGPHLHFEVRTRDKQDRYVAVDPMPLLTGEADARPRYRVNEGLTSIISRLFQ